MIKTYSDFIAEQTSRTIEYSNYISDQMAESVKYADPYREYVPPVKRKNMLEKLLKITDIFNLSRLLAKGTAHTVDFVSEKLKNKKEEPQKAELLSEEKTIKKVSKVSAANHFVEKPVNRIEVPKRNEERSNVTPEECKEFTRTTTGAFIVTERSVSHPALELVGYSRVSGCPVYAFHGRDFTQIRKQLEMAKINYTELLDESYFSRF